MRVHTENIRVRYVETDQMGVAHHASFLPWFELGRTGLLRATGNTYRELEERGFQLPVIEYNCRLVRGAHYDDELLVATRVSALGSRKVDFTYQVTCDGALLATGYTRHVCVSPSHDIRRFPPEVLDALALYRD